MYSAPHLWLWMGVRHTGVKPCEESGFYICLLGTPWLATAFTAEELQAQVKTSFSLPPFAMLRKPQSFIGPPHWPVHPFWWSRRYEVSSSWWFAPRWALTSCPGIWKPPALLMLPFGVFLVSFSPISPHYLRELLIICLQTWSRHCVWATHV